VRRQLIGTLSKGYRQRVGLADVLLHNPPVLILDEPTSGLDPTQIRETRGLIRELGREHTILLSTHILPEVEMTCDEVIVINRGRVVAAGPLDSLRSSAQSLEEMFVRLVERDDEEPLPPPVAGRANRKRL
jgi:ABC-2 type transport system ATP-binding protein